MKNDRVRIVDIAEELGLSTATVSNVIHGKTNKVSEETIKRVEALLEEREYIPSMAGLLLAQNSSGIVGVVINNHEKYEGRILEDPFISSSVNNLSQEIEDNSLFMMVKITSEYKEIIKFATMWNLVGLVLIGFCEQDYDLLRSKMRIPFVVYDGLFEAAKSRICNISIDDYDGGYQVGKYLVDTGHKRLLCISDNEESMDQKRIRGYQAAAASEDIAVDVIIVPTTKEKRLDFYMRMLDDFKSYDGIFVVSDIYAIALMQLLIANGISVPDDISIIGYDDMPICNMVYPALSAVHQDQNLRAHTAIEVLIKLSNMEEVKSEIKLPVSLIIRDSCQIR